MDGGDTASLPVTLDEAQRQLEVMHMEPEEVVADKGYHSNRTMTDVKERTLRSYVSEFRRGRRKWNRKRDAQKATYANRRRIRGKRRKRLLRLRAEKVERAFAHMLRDRRHAPPPHPGAKEHSKTNAPACGGLQPRASDA